MSTTEPVEVIAEPWDEFDAPPSVVRSLPGTAPIVPKDSIAGRSLTAVVAIMTFLASLTTGVAMLVVSAASDWQSEVSREVTIQVRPVPGRNIDADVRAASDIARATPGIADIRAFTKDESARLVEPWLGSGLSLDDLPIPRLIVVKIATGTRPDFAALSQALAARVPTSSLDDHRRWIDRMRTMAETAVFACIAVVPPAVPWPPTARLSKCCIMSAPPTASFPINSSGISSSLASRAAPSAAVWPFSCSHYWKWPKLGSPERSRAMKSPACSVIFPSA
jgi:hypothetical protein